MISFFCDICHGPIKACDGLDVYPADQPWIVCDFWDRLAVDHFQYKAEKVGSGHLACSLKCVTVAVNKWLEDKKVRLQQSQEEYAKIKEKHFIHLGYNTGPLGPAEPAQ